MKIFLNGIEVVTNAKNLSDLLLEQDIPANKIAVEVDLVVVPKSNYENFPILENAKIEIITFVGGG
jgi:thiamine biosynthesis protein ThiS